MARIICLAVLVSLLSLGIVSPATAGNPQGRGVVRSPPREPREGSVDNNYAGVVTGVTKDSITIQWTVTHGEKPKTFAVSETLAAGKVPMEPRRQPDVMFTYSVMPQYMYRLTDVKVGDEVGICYARVNGVDICDHIRIARRSDGLVPPLSKEAEDLMDPREEWKANHPGRPLPVMIANRPYTPYHEAMNAYWSKVAPMPREKGVLSAKIMQ